jgi:uncharacterized oxidoreductase
LTQHAIETTDSPPFEKPGDTVFMPTIAADKLSRFARDILEKSGVSTDDAHIVAESLVGANLRGYDSHGLMRLPYYVDAIRKQEVDPRAKIVVVSETAASITGDGGWGLGQVLCHDLLSRLADKAASTGIAAGTLRRAAHIGRLGEYAEKAAERGLVTMMVANSHGSGQRVAPVGGIRGRLGTNPICVGVPGGAEGPFVLDFGTSATAEGKVRVLRIAGKTCPPGWLLDSQGEPTTDPNSLYGDPPGSILPMGGDQAYKGFGLAYMIELLSGGLSGGQCAFPGAPPAKGNCLMLLVIDPRRMAGAEAMAREAAGLEAFVRGTPLKAGVDRVTLPGDPERRLMAERLRTGLSFDDANWNPLVKLAGECGVALPG